MSAFYDEFSKQSAAYARFRPVYPDELYAFLNSVVRGHDAAWDVGTGNGQCAVELAKGFTRVHASDPSAEQLARAVPRPNIEYRLGRAEESGLQDASVDLIAAANSAHWFDFERFIPEVRRVLKRDGIIALWGYSRHYSKDAALNRIMDEFGSVKLADYWPAPTKLMWAGYDAVPFPFETLPHPEFTIRMDWDFDQLLGYFATWSAVQRFIAAKGYDPIEHVRPPLAAAWGTPETKREIRFPMVMRIGRRQ